MKQANTIILMLMVAYGSLYAQKTIRVNAIKANNYGVVYTLPKSSFEITLMVKKTNYRRGDFYTYAQPYLGISNPITENRINYTLTEITVENKGIANQEESFMVEFKDKSFEPYLTLREDGIIVAVNSEGDYSLQEETPLPMQETVSVTPPLFFSRNFDGRFYCKASRTGCASNS